MINASDPENLVILDDKGSSIEHDPRDLEEWKLSGLNTWDYFSMFLKQT
jgi:hypothetical protein